MKKAPIGIDYNAPVVLTFALLSFVTLLLGKATGGRTTAALFSVYESPPTDPFYVFRYFGHVLGHTGIEHYSSNMLLLFLLGPMVEEKYGGRRLFAMMAAVAFVTGLANVVFFPERMLLGASGIVFMMMVLSSVTGMRRRRIPLTLLIVIVIYIGQEVHLGLTKTDNVSRITHVIGGLFGAAFGLALKGGTVRAPRRRVRVSGKAQGYVGMVSNQRRGKG